MFRFLVLLRLELALWFLGLATVATFNCWACYRSYSVIMLPCCHYDDALASLCRLTVCFRVNLWIFKSLRDGKLCGFIHCFCKLWCQCRSVFKILVDVFPFKLKLSYGVWERHFFFGGEYCSVRLADLIRTTNAMVVLFTRGQLWPSGIVVACVCLCVCVYVCVCVRQSSGCPDDNLSPAQATITKFGPEMQNTLIKIPIVFGVHWLWPSRSNLT